MRKVRINKKGITLVALVITIVVLLILAGVGSTMLTGNNGILKQASNAKENFEQAKNEEAKALAMLDAAANVNGTEYKEGDIIIRIPAGYAVSPNEGENNLEDGLVILDSSGNEYVWIEVPNNGNGPDYSKIKNTTDKSDEYYSDIYNALKNYAGVYANGSAIQNFSSWTEEWYDRCNMTWDGKSNYALVKAVASSSYYEIAKSYYLSKGKELYTTSDCITAATESSSSGLYVKITGEDDILLQDIQGCGLTYKEYNDLYRTMLQSIYENGGFWIGRYEVGDSTITTNIENGISLAGRTSGSGTTNTAVIKANQVPYNYVKCYEAEKIAEKFAKSGSKSSLLFGVQWDLVMKYLEVKNGATYFELSSGDGVGSKNWGNYSDNLWTITNTNAKSSVDYGTSWVNEAYGSKGTSEKAILLSTGADKKFSKMNIYDLAGNVLEWTLEHDTSHLDSSCASRGGDCSNTGSLFPASICYYDVTTSFYYNIGFRVTLY